MREILMNLINKTMDINEEIDMQKQKTVKDLKEIIEKYNITIIKLDVSLSEEEMCELTRLD